ncbi:mucin-binding protein, partial [Streptococcus sp. DD10]|uniref:mucin-binding protein n=1 Tax=Streptococcus sp. DD10 TaxID=1777878 RepID=UPI000ABF6ED0
HELVVDVTKPKKPGTPLLPEFPEGPQWPEGLAESDLKKEVTRTISYVKKDSADGAETKAKDDTVQTAHFSRVAHYNAVTKKVTYGDWTSTDKELPEVQVGVVAGYVADKASVGATTAPTPAADGAVTPL